MDPAFFPPRPWLANWQNGRELDVAGGLVGRGVVPHLPDLADLGLANPELAGRRGGIRDSEGFSTLTRP